MPDEEQTRQEPNKAETKSINFDTKTTCEPEFITKEHINRVRTMFGLAEATAEVMANNVINSLIANMDTIINNTFVDFSDKLAEALTETDIDAIIEEEVGENASEEEKKNKKREFIKEKAEKILSEDKSVIPAYGMIKQGLATNNYTKLRPVEGKNLTINKISGQATVAGGDGDFILTIPEYQTLKGLRTSTHQLFDLIALKFTGIGARNRTVVFTVKEYMERRELKDRKGARQQLVDDLNILLHSAISWTEKRGKATKQQGGMNITDKWEWADKKHTTIAYSFTPAFYEILSGYPTMPYPSQLQTLDSRRNPNSYYLLRKIAEHKKMNYDKKTADIISVRSLLKVAVYLPTYEEVMASDRHLDTRIVKPFVRDLNALSETLTWYFCHSNNEPLTDEELGINDPTANSEELPYDIFKDLLIHIDWKDYPEKPQKEIEHKPSKKKAPAKAKE